MNLPTPNEIRQIDDEVKWIIALNLMLTHRSDFTEQQWDVIKDCFKESMNNFCGVKNELNK